MQNLNGLLDVSEQKIVNDAVKMRFRDQSKFLTPESLIIHEQRFLDDNRLLRACMLEYNKKLEVPEIGYLPREIIKDFKDSDMVPYKVDTVNRILHVMVIPENIDKTKTVYNSYKVETHLVPLYHFVQCYTQHYGEPDFLHSLPDKDVFEFITSEAIGYGASDIYIVPKEHTASIYYDVRKKIIDTRRAVEVSRVDKLIDYILNIGGASTLSDGTKPKACSINIDQFHRGRVQTNPSYYGRMATIRVLDNRATVKPLEDLNLDKRTIKFLREIYFNDEPGLRCLIGETSSGKNTTVLSGLYEKLTRERRRAVSVELPVEILVPLIEQINCETAEEYEKNVHTLNRNNPGLLYLSEMTASTALAIMEEANTAKAVYSTIHANSITDWITRMQDLTGLPIDRIVTNLHSAVFQKLVRNEKEDKLYPVTRCMYFSSELRDRLFGKSVGEMYRILSIEEKKWMDQNEASIYDLLD